MPSATPPKALELIEREMREKTGTLDLGNLGLTEAPPELFEWSPGRSLEHLRVLNLGARLPGQIPSQNEGSRNRFTSFPASLHRFPALREVYLQGEYRNEHPLSSLPPTLPISLERLWLGHTQVADLSPLANLTNLSQLSCFSTQVADLSPLANLTNLSLLPCDYTQVADLSPLANLTNLSQLSCSSTQVADLSPLANLTNLSLLYCPSTQVADLSPLANLTNLSHLFCYSTQVADLSPLANLTNLSQLNCDRTRVTSVPRRLLFGGLRNLSLYEANLRGIPTAAISRSLYDNCLERLRAHVLDLDQGGEGEAVRDVKLIILGNGRVGKTQICRALHGDPFQEVSDSTHGVNAVTIPLSPDGQESAELNAWDFGGQDLYHGTHALFTKSQAIFLLVWDAVTESQPHHEHDGYQSENHPLTYWLSYIHHTGSKDAPVIVLQNKCEDRAAVVHNPIPAEASGWFRPGQLRPTHGSAKNGDLRHLKLELEDAVKELREREGLKFVGKARAEVIARLKDIRTAESLRPVGERTHRTFEKERFLELCEEAKEKTGAPISSPDLFLEYLHDIGLVFHRPNVFQGRIVLDQSWALEAVYAVFNRKLCVNLIQKQGGLFTESLLAETVWAEHTAEERKLFLSMMKECGICFVHRREDEKAELEAVYAAPELMPAKAASGVSLKGLWNEQDGETLCAELRFPFMSSHTSRQVISALGREAGERAEYWKFGVFLFERDLNSKALVEEVIEADYSGAIVIRTQQGRSQELLECVVRKVEETLSRAGMGSDYKLSGLETAPRRELEVAVEAEASPPLNAGHPPDAPKRVYISYKRCDRFLPLARDVRDVMNAGGARATLDEDELGLGADLNQLAQDIALKGDYVLLFLNKDYLVSWHCMRELKLTLDNRCQNDPELIRRIVIPFFDGINPMDGWLLREVQDYWNQQAAVYPTPKVKSMMHYFAGQAPEWLQVLGDMFVPRDLDKMRAEGWPEVLWRVGLRG